MKQGVAHNTQLVVVHSGQALPGSVGSTRGCARGACWGTAKHGSAALMRRCVHVAAHCQQPHPHHQRLTMENSMRTISKGLPCRSFRALSASAALPGSPAP